MGSLYTNTPSTLQKQVCAVTTTWCGQNHTHFYSVGCWTGLVICPLVDSQSLSAYKLTENYHFDLLFGIKVWTSQFTKFNEDRK